ncbi:MAG: hypothetical protein HY810_10120 [Candidatus Omnitrophica bacterium]|nr:hypothetical protein [Candidatus Omnitrophota bacterium]
MKKIFITVIIQMLLVANTASAEMGISLNKDSDYLSPAVHIDDSIFKDGVLNIVTQQRNIYPSSLSDRPLFVRVPFYYQTIFTSIFRDKSEGLNRLKRAVAEKSKKFLLKSAVLIDEGALKRVFRVTIDTDEGESIVAMRFYFMLRDNERGDRDPKSYPEVRKRALDEKEQLTKLHKLGGTGIEIFEYIDAELLDSSLHTFFVDNKIVGFTVGEFAEGYSLDTIDDLEEYKNLLRANVATITEDWFITLFQDKKPRDVGSREGFTIADLKPANFVYDQNIGKVRYIDADKPAWVILSSLLRNASSYIEAALNEKGILADNKNEEESILEEVYFSFIMKGAREGFENYLARRIKELGKSKQYGAEFKQVAKLKNILEANLAVLSQGEKKIEKLGDNKWQIKLRHFVLKEIAMQLIVLLEKHEHYLKNIIARENDLEKQTVGELTQLLVNAAI